MKTWRPLAVPRLGGWRRRATLVGTLVLGMLVGPMAPALHAAAENSSSEETAGKPAAAERHFRRGVDLYVDGDMSAASVEFSRAYSLVPNYKILYNLAQVAYRRQDYVRSLAHFRGYLADGGEAITKERRRQVEEDIGRLEQRIGHIAIDVSADDRGAEVRIDDLQVATAPLVEPLAVNVGARKVELLRSNGESQVRIVDVVGGETARLRFPRTALRLMPAASIGAADATPSNEALVASAKAERHAAADRGTARGTWLGWSAAGVLAAGAAVTGVLALSSSRDLQQRRDSYPLSAGELDNMGNRAHLLALTADGLLLGAAALAAWSLYRTLTTSSEEEATRGSNGPL